MQLNLFVAPTLRQSTKEVIKSISISHNIDERNFIVVPDRFSLQAEKLLFEELKISSTFNIDVISISKLAGLVLKMSGNEFELHNNLESILLIYKILIEHKSELESLKDANMTIDFAKEIFLTISQLKSCEIDREEFLKKSQILNSSKLEDIAKIYKLYENEDKIDASDMLNLFQREIENCSLIHNSNFYFAEFDSLTAQARTIIKLLVKSSKSVTIGTCQAISENNDYVYEKDIFSKVSQICSELRIDPNITTFKSTNNDFQNHLIKNLFAFKQEKKDAENKIFILNNVNIYNEIKNVANIIKFEIANNNLNFKDFNIFVPSLENYKKQLEEIFSYEDISYFIDETKSLVSLAPTKFIFKVLNFIKTKTIENFFILINDQFLKIESSYVELIYKNFFEKGLKINDILKLVELNKLSQKLNKINEKYEKITNFNDFIDIFCEIYNLFEISKSVKELIETFKFNKDLINEKLFMQFDNKFEKAIKQMKELKLSTELNKDEMENIASEICSTILISNLPLSTNAVFAGQNDVSFFEERKIGIFVGCSSSSTPLILKNSGLILDDDIARFGTLKIEPSIEMLNRRNKFKLFCDATLCSEKIYLSRLNSENLLPEFLKSFKNMWHNNGKDIVPSDDFFINAIGDENLYFQNLIFKSYLNCEREEILKDICQNQVSNDITLEKIKNPKDLFYLKNSTSISKIQTFFECPFKYFASFGLNLKENEVVEVQPFDIGSLFHSFAERFLKFGYKNRVNLEDYISDCFEYAKKSSVRLELISNLEENKSFFEFLKKLSYLFAQSLIVQCESENYLPAEFEKQFRIDIGKINGENYYINGRIDRIDKNSQNVILIDYKTGDTKIDLSKFYSGTKLQLPVYILALQNEFDVDGAFYFPVFMEGKSENKLVGIFNKKTNVIKKIDKTLSPTNLKSNTTNIVLKKESTTENFSVFLNVSGALNDGNLEKFAKYSLEVVKSGISESLAGDITALPMGINVCKSCPYYKLCLFNKEYKNFRKEISAVSEEELVEIVEKFDE